MLWWHSILIKGSKNILLPHNNWASHGPLGALMKPSPSPMHPNMIGGSTLLSNSSISSAGGSLAVGPNAMNANDLDKSARKQKVWSPIEDAILRDAITRCRSELGALDWSRISSHFGGFLLYKQLYYMFRHVIIWLGRRNGKQCLSRYWATNKHFYTNPLTRSHL